jgi:hypothetical protein
VLLGANNWFLPSGAWSIPANTLTVLPGSGFMANTTGGPLEINVTLGATFLQALSQFSCTRVIDGVWAGRFGFGAGLQTSVPYVEGIEYNGTANSLLVAWSRSRIYSGIPIRYSHGGHPLLGDKWSQYATDRRFRRQLPDGEGNSIAALLDDVDHGADEKWFTAHRVTGVDRDHAGLSAPPRRHPLPRRDRPAELSLDLVMR